MIAPLTSGRRVAAGRFQRADGQALVEFALILTPLVIILFGIIQFGFLFGGQMGLVNAAREAARYAATLQVGNSTTATADRALTLTELKNNIMPRSIPGYLGPSNLVADGTAGSTDVCYIAYKNADQSSGLATTTWSVRVRVQIRYRHPLFVPIVGNIVDGLDGTPGDHAFTLGASEEMRVENPPLLSQPTGLPTCP
jgi:Flp pilus assembly protein TadG